MTRERGGAWRMTGGGWGRFRHRPAPYATAQPVNKQQDSLRGQGRAGHAPHAVAEVARRIRLIQAIGSQRAGVARLGTTGTTGAVNHP